MVDYEDEIEEPCDVGSFNHGYLQIHLGMLLSRSDKYTAVSELSLDIGSLDLSDFDIRTKEAVKPDLSVYPKRKMSKPQDIIRMSEMPLAAIEILSPKQGTYDILEKFKIYFALGIKSCWLVEPATEVISVYSAIDQRKSFSNGDIVDENLDTQIALADIFE